MENNKKFWRLRAKRFDKLEWIKRENFLKAFIKFARPKKAFFALDLGTGTGVIAHHLAFTARRVMAIDISKDMIQKVCRKDSKVDYRLMNAESLIFQDGHFDLITARMVFHHIERLDKAMIEARRVLKKGGRLVICEGIPPDKSVRQRFVQIFKLKEKRHTFLKEDLVDLFKRAHFKNISLKYYVTRQVSMRNWLGNSGLPDKICEKIVRLHLDADSHFKRVYNMKVFPSDILFDWKFIFISGEK
jgi:ubiquinone/menaquinone biosynthesis C-methylase UbiE